MLYVIYGCIPLGVALDFLSKHWASQLFGGAQWMIRDVLGVFYVRHYGLWLMDLEPGNRAALWLGLLATFVLALCAWQTPRHFVARHTAFACLICGALGNTLERLQHQYVTDWLYLAFLPSALTINLADLFLVVGAFGMWAALLRTTPAPSPNGDH